MTSCTSFVKDAFIVVIKNETDNKIVSYVDRIGLEVASKSVSPQRFIEGCTGGLAYPHTILYGWLEIKNEAGSKTFRLNIFDKKSDKIKEIVITDEIWSYEYDAYGRAWGQYVDGKIVEVKKGE